jgi:hypothetical protein
VAEDNNKVLALETQKLEVEEERLIGLLKQVLSTHGGGEILPQQGEW